MAIFHLSVKINSRSSGRSAVGACAYRSGEKIRNENDGITHDYTKRRSSVSSSAYRSGENIDGHDFTLKHGVTHSEIMLPDHAPREYFDRSALWNAVEKIEKHPKAQTYREIVVALPNELNHEQNLDIVRDYVKRNFVDSGMCSDFSIHSGHMHAKKDEKYPFEDLTIRQENPHAHIMLTMRPINADGTWGAKSKKEYILDRNGDKIKLKSGEWKSRKIDATYWDKTSTLEKWREDWALTVNKEFELLGIDERISHLSLKERGIDREPTQHMGHEAWNLEKKGVTTVRGEINRAIYERNKTREQAPEYIAEKLHELKQNHYTLEKEIMDLQQISTETQREITACRFRAEEIIERAENIGLTKAQLDELKYQRQNMGFFKRKERIELDKQIEQLDRSCEQATTYFREKYNITPEQSWDEIKRLELKAKGKEHLHTEIQDKLKPLKEQRDMTIFEYQKQKMLVELRPDKEQIYSHVAVLEKERRVYKGLIRDDILRLSCEGTLNKVTEQNFQEIVKKIKPEQAKELVKIREHEKVRAKTRTYERGR